MNNKKALSLTAGAILTVVMAIFAISQLAGGTDKKEMKDESSSLPVEVVSAVVQTCSGFKLYPPERGRELQLGVETSSRLVYDDSQTLQKWVREANGSAIISQPSNTLTLPAERNLLTGFEGELNESPHFVLDEEWIIWSRSFNFNPRWAGAGYGGETYSVWMMRIDGSEAHEIIPALEGNRSVEVNRESGEVFYLGEDGQIYTITVQTDGTTTPARKLSNLMGIVGGQPRLLSGSEDYLIFWYVTVESVYLVLNIGDGTVTDVTHTCGNAI